MGKLTYKYEIRIGLEHKEAINKLRENGEDVAELLRNFLLETAKPGSIKKRKKEFNEEVKNYKTKAKKKEIEEKIIRKELKIKSLNTETEIIRIALKTYQEKATPMFRTTKEFMNQIQDFKDSLDSFRSQRETLKLEINELKKELL